MTEYTSHCLCVVIHQDTVRCNVPTDCKLAVIHVNNSGFKIQTSFRGERWRKKVHSTHFVG